MMAPWVVQSKPAPQPTRSPEGNGEGTILDVVSAEERIGIEGIGETAEEDRPLRSELVVNGTGKET